MVGAVRRLRVAGAEEDTVEVERANIRRLNRLLFGPQDYYLLARKPAEPGTGEWDAQGE